MRRDLGCLLSIDGYVTRRQLRWLGHVSRMKSERLPRKMLTSWVREKRPRGAPDFTYGRGVYKALRNVTVENKKLHYKAKTYRLLIFLLTA